MKSKRLRPSGEGGILQSHYERAVRGVHELRYSFAHHSGSRFVMCACRWATLEGGGISHEQHIQGEIDALRAQFEGRRPPERMTAVTPQAMGRARRR